MTQPWETNNPPPQQQDPAGYAQQAAAAQQQYQQQYAQYAAQYGYPQQQYYMEPKHSGFGIASFIISLIVGLLELAMVIGATAMVMKAGPGGFDEKSAEAIVVGVLLLVGVMIGLLGIVLGLIGCFQGNRRKVFAILGTVINGLILFVVLGLMAIGMMQ
jgi:hypothetical protein